MEQIEVLAFVLVQRLICTSKSASGETSIPHSARMTPAKSTLLARFTAMKRLWKARSLAKFSSPRTGRDRAARRRFRGPRSPGRPAADCTAGASGGG